MYWFHCYYLVLYIFIISLKLSFVPLLIIAFVYTLIAMCAINIFVIININTDIIMSLGVATPTITLNGAENGDENGTIDDIKFKLLVGLVIVKYAK